MSIRQKPVNSLLRTLIHATEFLGSLYFGKFYTNCPYRTNAFSLVKQFNWKWAAAQSSEQAGNPFINYLDVFSLPMHYSICKPWSYKPIFNSSADIIKLLLGLIKNLDNMYLRRTGYRQFYFYANT
jgi:hypothetical protein